ncbi:hypothetical protein BH09VER1_BH09VER1_28770 [soil metagenome]
MGTADLATRIEMFLLMRGDWVPVAEICREFDIPERMLRADGHRRPLCRHFAISSSKGGENGLKHLSLCTVRERITYKNNRRKRLIAEARALQEYGIASHNCLTGKKPLQIERHTGQGILL